MSVVLLAIAILRYIYSVYMYMLSVMHIFAGKPRKAEHIRTAVHYLETGGRFRMKKFVQGSSGPWEKRDLGRLLHLQLYYEGWVLMTLRTCFAYLPPPRTAACYRSPNRNLSDDLRVFVPINTYMYVLSK